MNIELKEEEKLLIKRSPKRTRSISAHFEGELLVVQAPQNIPDAELDKIIQNLRARLLAKKANTETDDAALQTLAEKLNNKYFGAKLHWQSIRWVSNQKHRYGSCTPSLGTIRINDQLKKAPQWVLEYVVMHELAHLLEGNHGEKFWKLVQRYPLAERARGFLMGWGMEEASTE